MKPRFSIKQSVLFVILFSLTFTVFGEDTLSNSKKSFYRFSVIKANEAMPVQDQNRSSTCWSFSTLSFMESELLRMGKGHHLLSEMYIVRNAWIGKADMYVRMQGHYNFSGGGAFNDIPWVIKRYGIIPQSAYSGLNYGTDKHTHAELDAVLKGFIDAVKDNPQKALTPAWKGAFEGILNAYLGPVPENFEYQGKKYTPQSFATYLGLNMDDYVSLTSFTHHPFYSSFVIEVPDNWAMTTSYNLPLNEFMQVMESAIMNGYTFAWGSDVSEKGFSHRNGIAIVPADDSMVQVKGKDNVIFNNPNEAERSGNAFIYPMTELQITQELRQKAFDSQETTDDHGMHITGLVKDQNGTKYFIVKNSWGTKYNDCDGYLYASWNYVAYKTMNIMIHKNAIPKDIAKKLGIK
ncbi:MAG: C1 family peptidase [Bacteroidia bacterium]|nr:C1 family peptidase [Bacteroidia bacterium]